MLNYACASKRQILALAGLLAHCAHVVRGGRTFSRRIINLANYMRELSSVVRLPEWFKDDLQWWKEFVRCFNGRASIIISSADTDVSIWTDSSLLGFEGWCEDDWFTGVWHMADHRALQGIPVDNIEIASHELVDRDDINIMELWPILCAIRRWGPVLRNKKVLCRTDDQQVIYMLKTGRSRSYMCMRWLRELFWMSFVHNIHIVPLYIRSGDNIKADILSRLVSGSVTPKFRELFCINSRGGADATVV